MTDPYYIDPEFYVAPATYYDGRVVPAIEFHYVIRRSDDSVLYRTQTHEYAADILANLLHPKQERQAA